MAEGELDDKGQVGYSKVDLPEGFETEGAFVKWCRETFEADLAADDANRRAAVEDAEFFANEQWDETDEKYRRDNHLPVLTVNQLPAFVGTVIGNRRMNEVTASVSPDSGTTRGIANLREGIIRNILKNSASKRAFDKAFENQVISGMGNTSVSLEYANNDVFDQVICVNTIAHPLAVVWDRFSDDPTGMDAQHVFQAEQVKNAEHDQRWPKADGSQFGGEVDQWAKANGWLTNDDKRVVTVWRMNRRTKTLAMLTDGTVIDLKDKTGEEYNAKVMSDIAAVKAAVDSGQITAEQAQQIKTPQGIVTNPKTKQLMVRESPALYAQRWVVNGAQILEGPYELPIDRVPVFRAMGWETNIGPRKVRWGLVRLAKDPQRLLNFWRSVIAEKLLYAPKATVMGPRSAFEGIREEWKNAHMKRDPLEYNDEAPAGSVQFVQPPPPDTALLQQASLSLQDMRDVLNLHEASMGIQSNEVSAKAIVARQKLGELGTVIYNDNSNSMIEEVARVINQLIPVAYDTPRYIKATSVDDKEVLTAINSGQDDDITLGTYGITISTGPSYVTKRAEAAEGMMNFINAAPQVAAVAPDLIVEAQDWPNAEAISARFKRSLDPRLIGEDEMTPEQAQAQQQQALVAQKGMELEFAQKQADIEETQARTVHAQSMSREAQARAVHAQAQAASSVDNAGTERMKAVGDIINAEHDRLADMYKVTVQANAQLERDRATRDRLGKQGEKQ